MKEGPRFSPISLAILALLFEEPMHPYRMQQLLIERGKDQVINVRQRASLYQAIERLLRQKLISIKETTRDERWPERTVYELTPKGYQTAVEWLREMLSNPIEEFPDFPAALAYLPLLTPEDARIQLEWRARRLELKVEMIDSELKTVGKDLPRLFLIESEYLRALTVTELEWVRALIKDLSAGTITWSEEWMRGLAGPPGETGKPPEA